MSAQRIDAVTVTQRIIHAFGSFAVSTLSFVSAISQAANPPSNVSIYLLQFGGSVAHLVWVGSDLSAAPRDSGNKYLVLADDINRQIELSRATVAVSTANFKVISTGLVYLSTMDLEPASRAALLLGAWGAKKTGEWVGDKVTQQVNSDVLGVASRLLKENQLAPQDFLGLSDEALKNRLDELRIGGQTLKDALKEVPGGSSMVEGYVIELKQNEQLAILSQVKANGQGINDIKQMLKDDYQKLDDYAHRLGKKLDDATATLTELKDSSNEMRIAIHAVADDVKEDRRALQDLSAINYMGWTTNQRLAALQSSDMFPNIKGKARDDVIVQLKAELKQERAVSTLNGLAGSVGSLAKIVGNLGIDPNLATNLQGAQLVVQGVSGFVSGNPLAAVATLSSLAGLGRPDPTMAALAQIDHKLNIIIDLQKKTLEAIQSLSDQMVAFHTEEMQTLNRIENTVLVNAALIQAIAQQSWDSCDALLTFRDIHDLATLTSVLENGQSAGQFRDCYDAYVKLLDGKLMSGKWAAQKIDMITFPAETVISIPDYQKQIRALADEKLGAYSAIRKFLILRLDANPISVPVLQALLRLDQPVATVAGSVSLARAVEDARVQARFQNFTCGDESLLQEGVRAILCYRTKSGDAPDPQQWSNVLNQTLLGPQAYRLIDDGLQIAVLADFFIRPTNAVRDVFVKSADVKAAGSKGLSKDMQEAVSEKKGLYLLKRLKWVADALVLQESMLSGGYTAELLEDELYDGSAHALRIDRAQMSDRQKAAFDALRANPILARNTILLAMRHAIADGFGGIQEAQKYAYGETPFLQATSDFATGNGCIGKEFARARLADLLPQWQFEYRVTKDDKSKEPDLQPCVDAADEQPRGLYVKVGDLVVAAPSPLALASGSFEVSEQLRLALQYREKVSQAIVDRSTEQIVRSTATKLSKAGDKAVSVNSLAKDFLDHAYQSPL